MRESCDAIRQAYADYFRQFAWDHFCTFTAKQTGDDDLVKGVVQTVRRLNRVAQGPVEYVWFRERGSVAGTRHVHVLLLGTRHVSAAGVENAWRKGKADAAVYEPHRGGAFYLTKSLFADDELWDCSPGLGRSAIGRPPTSCTWSEDGWPDLPL